MKLHVISSVSSHPLSEGKWRGSKGKRKWQQQQNSCCKYLNQYIKCSLTALSSICQSTEEYAQYGLSVGVCGTCHLCEQVLDEVSAKVSSLPIWTTWCYFCLPHVFKCVKISEIWGLEMAKDLFSVFILQQAIAWDLYS